MEGFNSFAQMQEAAVREFSVIQTGVGRGADAWEAANNDPRHVMRVVWGLTKLDGIAGGDGCSSLLPGHSSRCSLAS